MYPRVTSIQNRTSQRGPTCFNAAGPHPRRCCLAHSRLATAQGCHALTRSTLDDARVDLSLSKGVKVQPAQVAFRASEPIEAARGFLTDCDGSSPG